MKRSKNWDEDDKVDPIKGPNRPTEFLRANFKILGKGGSFRTVKAKFPPATIQASAKRAGVYIRIDEEGPWLKVTVLGNVPPQPEVEKKPHTYQGAGKVYPREKPVIQSSTTRRKAPKLDISLHGGGFKNWRQFQKQPEIDIFS